MRKLFLIAAALFLFPLFAFAHQPRIVEGNGLTQIKNPDISQAFYGDLNGGAHEFEINLPQAKEIYLGILVPDLPNENRDILVEITSYSDRNFYYRL
ncbi:MAG: hypothetical protein Q8N69_02890, partial [bacterium]|nr:hypothetical protein [bacterium]